MITYEPPKQQEVNVGDRIDGVGVVLDPRDLMEEVLVMRMERAELLSFIGHLIRFLDPAERQDSCNRECPAYVMCKGGSACAFPDWAVAKAHDLGLEV